MRCWTPLAGLAAVTLLIGGGCNDSRLAPAGLREAGRSARESSPVPGKPPGRVRPRARPRPAAGAVIATPPFRLDVRVEPADLALLPANAAVVAALRPDLPQGLAALLGPHWAALTRLPALQWLGPELLTTSLATPLGLRPDRAILVALLAPEGQLTALDKHLSTQVARIDTPEAGAALRAALNPARLPPTTMHLRLVARVADAKAARAGLGKLVARARRAGHTDMHLVATPTAPALLRGLAPLGVVVAGHGKTSAHAWTLTGDRLVLDVLLPVSGAWSARRVATELRRHLVPPASPAAPVSPFARLLLLSSADLTLVIRSAALARAARWLGIGQLLEALRAATTPQLQPWLRKGWRIAYVPVAFRAVDPRPFAAFGARVYLLGPKPQLRLSWLLTPTGRTLFDAPTAAVGGQDLGRDNGLVERWLKPLAALVPKTLPAAGPFAQPDVTARLFEGGLFMWVLAVAELWPRLLPLKPVRKAVLKILRQKVHPGRYVRRLNVQQQGNQLELVLEGKPPAPKAP